METKKYTLAALEAMAKRTNNKGAGQKPKMGVFGSRTLFGDEVVEAIITAFHEWGCGTIVTTQEPRGVCTVAQNVAKRLAIPLELHFLNNAKYAQGMHSQRSKEVVDAADVFLVIHDGVSHGTANELKLVEKSGKPHKLITLAYDHLAHHNDQKLDSLAGDAVSDKEEDPLFDFKF